MEFVTPNWAGSRRFGAQIAGKEDSPQSKKSSPFKFSEPCPDRSGLGNASENQRDPQTLHALTVLQRTLRSLDPVGAMERATANLSKLKTSAELLRLIHGVPTVTAGRNGSA